MRIPNQQGQTLIEVLVAIVVMFTGMLGVLSLAQSNMNNERLGVDRLAASQLAREAVEVMRATRDTNFMQTTMLPTPPGNPWDKDIRAEFTVNGLSCGTLDIDKLVFNSTCPNDVLSSEYQLKRNTTTGVYNLTTGTPTRFFRKLTTRPLCLEGTNEIARDSCFNLVDRIGLEVRAEVGWIHVGNKKNVILTEQLYNWR